MFQSYNHNPYNFARTATKVDFWRRADDPTRNLKSNEFTVNDVLEGRVIAFYDDKEGGNNQCSVLYESPENRYHIGSIFVGNQKHVDDLHWYDRNTLMKMLPRQKYDPDTGLPWGDVSNLSNRKILSRFRHVVPISELNRFIT
jgi:hypothetical protein